MCAGGVSLQEEDMCADHPIAVRRERRARKEPERLSLSWQEPIKVVPHLIYCSFSQNDFNGYTDLLLKNSLNVTYSGTLLILAFVENQNEM